MSDASTLSEPSPRWSGRFWRAGPAQAKGWVRTSFFVCAAFLVACAGMAALTQPADAAPDRRVALVIGNGSYSVAPALDNPLSDAKAVAAALKRLQFEVIEGYDLTYAGMRQTIGKFSNAIENSSAALVYYAGHGVSVDDENFLLPTDIALKNASDLDLNAVSLSLILRQMKREERVNVVILDACRDNPFARELASGRGRSVVAERGLSRVDVDLAKGTMIAFATDPRSTALDGKAGENSPFTKALLRHIETPGASIDTIMNRVRAEVWTETRNKQMPWVNTSIIGEFILNPGPPTAMASAGASLSDAPPPPLSVAPDRVALDVRFWDSAERGGNLEDYKAYLSAWPNGLYSEMAKARIARLSASAAPIAPPAPVLAGASPQALAALASEPRRDSGAAAEPAKSEAVAIAPAKAEPAKTEPVKEALAAPPASAPTDVAPSPVDAATRAEVATLKTEADLKLNKAARAEVQARLAALGIDPGARDGDLGQSTREALAKWQGSRGMAATGWLAPLALAALKAQSEPKMAEFRKAEAARAAVGQARAAAKARAAREEAARERAAAAAEAAAARRSLRAKSAAEATRKARVRKAVGAAAPRRAARRAPAGGYDEPYEPPPRGPNGPYGGAPYGGGNPGIGGFLGGVAAGAILNGAFRRR